MSSNQAAMSDTRIKGMALVLTGALFWGVSGTVAQYLFQNVKVSPEWLTVVRLLSSGLLLLAIAYKTEKDRTWAVWKNKRDALHLFIFSILGMLAVQYTYFAAIQYSNAATATVLQYLGPVLITLYVAVMMRRWPRRNEAAAVLLAVLGTFLLVTQGNIKQLSISGLALFWGLSSAVAMAFYTLYPHSLLTKWGSTIIVGWAMFIGGAAFSFVHPPWRFEAQWSIPAALAIAFIIIFGTLIAFYCYLESLKYLSASETSLLASVEPLSAAITSVIWLNVSFGLPEWSGTFCILATIVLLSSRRSRK